MQKLDRLIRLYAVEHNTALNDIARDLHMSKDALCMRRKGKTPLSFKEANDIAHLLNLSLDELAQEIL